MEMAPEPEKEQDDRSPALPSAADMISWQPKGYSTFLTARKETRKLV